MNDAMEQIPAKILVVDDEPDMAELVRRKFRKRIHEGMYSFLFAEDGYDALRVIESEPDIDLIITDINMPRMDGLTLLNHLDEAAPLMKSVIVSAYGDMDNIRTAMNRGAFDFVTKPINFGDLEVTINKTLNEIALVREAHRQRAAAQRERGQLARYFPPAVVDRLISDPSTLNLNVERREMSFVFTDLAGFTPLIEKSNPIEIVPIINNYFSGMVEIAFRHEGTIDKVVGDGIDVFFGAPIEQTDHAARSVACALDMDDYARSFARDQRARGVPIGETRIGVSSGDALFGNFGCERLMHYTAYGDAVNTAARLQNANRPMGTRICVSEATAERIPGFNGLPIGRIHLKGKHRPVMVYQPRRASEQDDEFSREYLAAFDLLEKGNEGAEEKFAEIIDRYPDAQLAALHLKRLRHGAKGIDIDPATL